MTSITIELNVDDEFLLESITDEYRTVSSDNTPEGAFVNTIFCRLVNAKRRACSEPIKHELEG